jgi:conjugal transfer pilus assembly protein TraB
MVAWLNRVKQSPWWVWVVLSISVLLWWQATTVASGVNAQNLVEADFTPVFDEDFTRKNNQSALQHQQLTLEQQSRLLRQLERRMNSQQSKLTRQQTKVEQRFDSLLQRQQQAWQQLKTDLQAQVQATLDQTAQPPQAVPSAPVASPAISPTSVTTAPISAGMLVPASQRLRPPTAVPVVIESVVFEWDTPPSQRNASKTLANYVPAGSFVTAVVTGGADANAGVNGPGDTAPVVFRAVNNGYLPNGHTSHLQDCVVTGGIYGEISSSRGIVRTHRLSCVFDDQILDVPVKGTVFNYGRNGIRGTPIMKNGQIVTMAGLSGLLAGIGQTAGGLSQLAQRQRRSAADDAVDQRLDNREFLRDLLGQGVENASAKLSDYYIQLAQQYHPIIEINPGAVVNIVFLEGFSLTVPPPEPQVSQLASAPTATSPLPDWMQALPPPVATSPERQP